MVVSVVDVRSSHFLLSLCTLAWTVCWLLRAAFSPVAPLIRGEFSLSYTELGLIPTATFLISALGFTVEGFFAGKYGS